MRLNLKDIILVNGGKVTFETQLDLTQLDFYGTCPVMQPIQAVGQVKNTAGVLELTATLTAELQLTCDRCGKDFHRTKCIRVQNLVADHLDNEVDDLTDEILLLDGNELDLDEALTTAFILDMDTKILCQEDCKGLCVGCGVNLNREPCRCKREVDPRLAALARLLEQQE